MWWWFQCTSLKKMYSIKYKEVVIEGGNNHCSGFWDIIIPSHTNYKTSIQTNNHTTTASHAILYATTIKYKRQNILSLTAQRPACTQQSLTWYIQEFGTMNVLIYYNWNNNYIEQPLQEYIQKQLSNFIIRQDKTKSELVRYLHGACFSPFQSTF